MTTLPQLRPRVPHDNAPYQFHRAVFYPVGAGDAVYEPAPPIFPAMLPIVNISGNGILAGAAPNPNQLPQVYANKTALVSGIGGVMAGQIFGQPLAVPETTNGSQ
jgi:hypothetical protein